MGRGWEGDGKGMEEDNDFSILFSLFIFLILFFGAENASINKRETRGTTAGSEMTLKRRLLILFCGVSLKTYGFCLYMAHVRLKLALIGWD